MTSIKSALTLGLRPSAHIGYLKKPASNWSEIDHKIAVAYSRLEAEICDKCGNPIWVCRNEFADVTFNVKTYRCFADSELDKRRKKWEEKNKNNRSKTKPDRLKSGEYEYVVVEPGFGQDRLPTRIEWLKALNNSD